MIFRDSMKTIGVFVALKILSSDKYLIQLTHTKKNSGKQNQHN